MKHDGVSTLTDLPPQEGLTDDDYDMYYEIWQQFDPNGTQYIKYNQLSDFLDVLESPLQIHKPNKYKIISMDIPICKGDLCFCVDVLDALTKDFFARKGNPVEETAELGEVTAQADRPGYDPISSTLWRQREEYCARMIQVFFLKKASRLPCRMFFALHNDKLCFRECGDVKHGLRS